MSELDFLNYLNRTPYKEVLACLALKEGMNSFQLLDKLIDRSVGTTATKLKKTLNQLGSEGLIASVNSAFYFQEKWLKELILFLDEFEESKKEMDLCQILLNKPSNKAFFSKK